ncbi:uncharacterized protein K452DRAFT_291664 [Aplosporella prunicola CBS 121167]|uniref:Uncharacterized protein n=1 Tax=Aplosporella prunicola CBS 121167 TaxID=1176127 RepID=A0A6A6AZQ2_9PEZI|nr:uncharacterized protein K452DRAFT_291664 [Aplosporella prunicola CBS 121167]KAF2137422.1 hypothetical protein K452DRAFT_291664 [Aplosporella prunicola CBS 121167]
MASFFSATKTAKPQSYPLARNVTLRTVLTILHDHALLARIFWPGEPASALLHDENTSPYHEGDTSTSLTIGPPSTSSKVLLTTLRDGAKCTEELPLGITITVTYTVTTRDGDDAEEKSTNSTDDTLTGIAKSGLDRVSLREERTVAAFRPVMPLVKCKDEVTVKTRNLLRVMEAVGKGEDVEVAVEGLGEGGLGGACDGASSADGDVGAEKCKAE